MTIVTDVATGDMVGRLAGCNRAVVTTETGAQHVGMIDTHYRRPGRGEMAILAYSVGLDVRGVLAGCGTAVVTRRAVAGHRRMIEYGRYPGSSRMTIITGITAGNMICHFPLCYRSVVATEAGAKYISMINACYRNPGRGGMAILTGGSALDMRGVLAGRRAAIVASRTVSGHRCMVEQRRYPGIGGMTIVTGVGTGDMVGCLAGCDRPVVTAEAGTRGDSIMNENR